MAIEIISAKNARGMTKAARDAGMTPRIVDLLSQIERAAQSGHSSIPYEVPWDYEKHEIEWFTKHGYNVTASYTEDVEGSHGASWTRRVTGKIDWGSGGTEQA